MILSLTAADRPGYLAQVLTSVVGASQRCSEDVYLVASVEPTPFARFTSEMLHPFNGVTVVQDQRLGLQANTLAALDLAWELAELHGEDFVLHLEDDLVLAPDALECAVWMRDTFRECALSVVPFVSLTRVGDPPPADDHHRVILDKWFECHVWGTWRSVWESELRPAWPHAWPNHWAAIVNDGDHRAVPDIGHEPVMKGRYQAQPALSRSYSIGVRGVHCDVNAHATHNPFGDWAGTIDVLEGEWWCAD